MRSALLKAELESALGPCFNFREKPAPDTVPIGIPEVDSLAGGLPRGAVTEIVGPVSSGRTTLLLSALAEATARREVCALVDPADAFDPTPAAAAGVNLSRLLWVRCRMKTGATRWRRLERALRAADLLVEGGGFGLVVLDLGDIAPRDGRRIPLSCWFRLRRAVENTPASLLIIAPESYAKSCASLVLEMRTEGVRSQESGARSVLRGAHFQAISRKPVRSAAASFGATNHVCLYS